MNRQDTRRVATEVAAQLATVVANLDTALGNLDDAQPGFPTSVHGASAATGGGVPDGLKPLERAALNPDEARTALARVHRLVADLRVPAAELYSLTAQWSYAKHTVVLDLADNTEWCDSCLRLQRCEPRTKGRWCWFCSDMRTTVGHLPSLALLAKHHRGERITADERRTDRAARI